MSIIDYLSSTLNRCNIVERIQGKIVTYLTYADDLCLIYHQYIVMIMCFQIMQLNIACYLMQTSYLFCFCERKVKQT